MDPFVVGLIVLAAATIIVYIVFFAFIYYWHLKAISYLVVPAVFTFEFFATCFFVVVIVSIILKYLPGLLMAI